jgi:hypothetical protein
MGQVEVLTASMSILAALVRLVAESKISCACCKSNHEPVFWLVLLLLLHQVSFRLSHLQICPNTVSFSARHSFQ